MTQRVLLYDGACGFCGGAVRFALRQDPGGTLRFAALQSAFGIAVRARHPEVATLDSLLWVEGAGDEERVWSRTDGALRLARYLGGVWRVIGAVIGLVPRVVRDAAYDAFAKRRYAWFGTSEACPLPTAEQRLRFITDDAALPT